MNVGASVQQSLNRDLVFVGTCGYIQRSQAPAALRVDVCSSVKKRLNDPRVFVVCRPVQRRNASTVPRVNVRSSGQHAWTIAGLSFWLELYAVAYAAR